MSPWSGVSPGSGCVSLERVSPGSVVSPRKVCLLGACAPRNVVSPGNVCYRSREGSHKVHVVTSVDRFCIDKRSSAELSEAINSMYRWYSDCAVCYAYLADVPNDVDAKTQMEKFRQG